MSAHRHLLIMSQFQREPERNFLISPAGRTPIVNLADYIRPDWYLRKNADVDQAGQSAYGHFLGYGHAEGRDPNPMFDSHYYRTSNPDVRGDWLRHYAEHGWREGRNPHEWFSVSDYLRANPDVAENNIDPLLHYVKFGRDEGRAPSAKHRKPSKPIALLADEYCPDSSRDAGSVSQLAYIKIFQNLGYEVHHFAIYDHASSELDDPKHCANLMRENGVHVIAGGRDCSSIDDYLFRYGKNIKVAFLSRYKTGMALLELFKLLCPRTKIIFNTVDLHHLRERRHARIQQAPQVYELAKTSERCEFEMLRKADASIVVSSFERQYLEERGFDVAHIPLLQDFRDSSPPGYAGRAGIGFIGEPSHSPNHDAVKSFLSEVWPILHSSRPELTLSLAGAGWRAVFENENVPGVKLLGRVVGLEGFFDPLMLTIAPLRYGAGTKGKIVSSLGNGVPCVATSIAVEGMDLTEGKNIVVADTAEDFANAVLSLYDDRGRWEQISRAGLEFHRENCSLSHGTALTYKMLQSADALPA